MEKILFKVPEEFIEDLISKKVIRDGAILKDSKTGKIVGHLKEVGKYSNIIENFFNPFELINDIVTNIQLHDIRETLSTLNLIASMGAFSSIVTLGVSVVGFGVLINKLNSLENSLEKIITNKALGNIVKIDQKLEFKFIAELSKANEMIEKALITENNDRRKYLLNKANDIFMEYKNYYFNLFIEHGGWKNTECSIEEMVYIFNKFVSCIVGELHSEFLLNDKKNFYFTLEKNLRFLNRISEFDSKIIFDFHSKTYLPNQYEELINKINSTSYMIEETNKRIESFKYEMKYIENKGLEPLQYINYLRKLPDNIILITDE